MSQSTVATRLSGKQEAVEHGLAARLDQLGPECADWRRHWHTSNIVPRNKLWRHFTQLALSHPPAAVDEIYAGSNVAFVASKRLAWHSLVDVLPEHALIKSAHIGQIASSRHAVMRYGMPFLPRAGDEVNLRLIPGLLPESVRPKSDPWRMRLLDSMQWALTSKAMQALTSLSPYREAYARKTGTAPEGKPLYAGGDRWLALMAPAEWMPRPYLGVRKEDYPLLEAEGMKGESKMGFSVRQAFMEAAHQGLPIYSNRDGIAADVGWADVDGFPATRIVYKGHRPIQMLHLGRKAQLHVKRGDRLRIGTLVATTFKPFSRDDIKRRNADSWLGVIKEIGNAWPSLYSFWLRSRCLELQDGLYHLPADIISSAARKLAVPDSLIWDVKALDPLYHEDIEAYLPPAVFQPHALAFQGQLPFEVAHDFTPACLDVNLAG
jgi:hypothetical protein